MDECVTSPSQDLEVVPVYYSLANIMGTGPREGGQGSASGKAGTETETLPRARRVDAHMVPSRACCVIPSRSGIKNLN